MYLIGFRERETPMIAALVLALIAQVGPAPPVATPAQKRLEIARKVVDRLVAGEFDAATEPFDTIMKVGLPPAQLKAAWLGSTQVFGKFRKLEGTRAESLPTHEIVFVTLGFERGKLDAKLVFNADQQVAGFFFLPAGKYQTPTYVDATKFAERELQVGKGFMPLTGTLALPKGDGPFAAVVLVHGSGPHDRDESIGPNKPFRDLAQGLASRGIAVLRYEKRTKQYPLAMALLGGGITVKQETIDDSVAAVHTLAAQEKIDPRRIFVLGHSLGGMLLPRIAEACEKAAELKEQPAGYISLAGSTRPMEDLILEQSRYLLSLDGPLTDDGRKQLEQIEQQVAKVKGVELATTAASELPLGVPAKYWLDLRDCDPAKMAISVKQPMLILQGERDYQVTLDDFAGWRDAVGTRADVKLIAYPDLNHLFIAGEGKSTPAEYFSSGNVDEKVVGDVAAWIERRK